MSVFEYSFLMKAMKLRNRQRRIARLVLPVKEELNKDYTRKKIMTYVIIRQSVALKFFPYVAQISKKHLVGATIAIKTRRVLGKKQTETKFIQCNERAACA